MRYPLLSQVALLTIGLIVPVGVPAFIGLDYYGHFVSATASAFLIQRLTDFPAETMIYEGTRRHLLLRTVSLQAAALALATAVSNLTSFRIDLVFLLSLQCSSVAFSMVLACRNDRFTLLYLISFLVAYLISLLLALVYETPLTWAIAAPNYLSLLWIPWTLCAPIPEVVKARSAHRLTIPDITLRVGAGSFIAFATLGLATMSSNTNATNTAEIRVLGTALGFSAFLLPWPMKSLVDLLRGADQAFLKNLQRYLQGARWIAIGLLVISVTIQSLRWSAICVALSLLFLNFLVIERWNVARTNMIALARTSLIATACGFAAFYTASPELEPPIRAAVAIMSGCVVYSALSWMVLHTTDQGRKLNKGLAWASLAGAVLLSWKSL